jgi:hypothetical protein
MVEIRITKRRESGPEPVANKRKGTAVPKGQPATKRPKGDVGSGATKDDYHSWTYRRLQALCKSRSPKAKGTAVTLRGRLMRDDEEKQQLDEGQEGESGVREAGRRGEGDGNVCAGEGSNVGAVEGGEEGGGSDKEGRIEAAAGEAESAEFHESMLETMKKSMQVLPLEESFKAITLIRARRPQAIPWRTKALDLDPISVDLKRRIGEGAFGEVHLVQNKMTKELFAVKLRNKIIDKAEQKRWSKAEGGKTRGNDLHFYQRYIKTAHPNIVSIEAFFERQDFGHVLFFGK